MLKFIELKNRSSIGRLLVTLSLLGLIGVSCGGSTKESPKPMVNYFPEPAFVSLKKASKVEQFPSESVWNGGPNMLYNSVTPDGKVLLATSPNTSRVHAFDTRSGKKLAVIKVGKGSKGIKISPNGKEAYVTNEAEASISVIKLSNFKVVAKIKTKKKPHNVRFNKKGSRAYVTLQGGAGLGVIHTRKRKMIKVIPIKGLVGPHNLDLSKNGKYAFVRDTYNTVAVVRLRSGKVKKLIKVGLGHAGIDVIPNGKYVFTGAIGDKVVTVINAKTLKVVKKIEVGKGPHGVRASKNSRWVYVSVTDANTVVVIDTKTLKVAKTYKVGQFPFWISVNGNP